MNKDQIYNETVEKYVRRYGRDYCMGGTCMYWALTAGLVFQRHGVRSLIQAGSMQWPAFDDDGLKDTHFGYEWSPNDMGSQAALLLGLFPEIHVWLALPERQEIVDFSVRYLPEAAAKDGKVWVKPPPPKFLWATLEEMPEGVFYRPEIGAIAWLLARLEKDGYVKTNSKGLDLCVK